jgi:hypothetical protein
MPVRFRRIEGGYEGRGPGGRVEILHRPRYAKPWLLVRMKRRPDGSETEGGTDDFRTLADAKRFATGLLGAR